MQYPSDIVLNRVLSIIGIVMFSTMAAIARQKMIRVLQSKSAITKRERIFAETAFAGYVFCAGGCYALAVIYFTKFHT